jgi:hypothetical protein
MDVGFLVFLGGLFYLAAMALKAHGWRFGCLMTILIDGCGGVAMATIFGWNTVTVLVVLIGADIVVGLLAGSPRRRPYRY